MSDEREWEIIDYKVEKIPVDEIFTGRFQSRTLKVEEELEDLAENIRKLGLINPVTVFRLPNGEFELITGQRRLMAIKDILCWKEIPARILPFEPTEDEGKAISLSENIMRNPLTKKDMKVSILNLYRRSGASGKELERVLGIPYHFILDVIGYEGLPQSLKDKVDEGEIKVDLAKRAVKAATSPEGVLDEEKAINITTIMKPLLPKQQRRLAKISLERPDAAIEDLADEARKPARSKRIYIEMLTDDWGGLVAYAASEEINEGEAATRILVASLKNMGFLS